MKGRSHGSFANLAFVVLIALSVSACGGGGSEPGDNSPGDGAKNNQPPEADAGADLTINEGATITLDGSASGDPDGDTMNFHWQAPSGIALAGETTLNPTFVAPNVTEDAVLTFTLTVDDGNGGSDSDTVNVNVKLVNLPPVANAGTDQIVNAGTVATLDASASADPDGDEVTFVWKGPKGVAVFDAATMRPSFVVPDLDEETVLEFNLEIIDSRGGKGTDSVLITANQSPIADAGVDRVVNEREGFTLVGGGSDSEGDELKFEWSAPEGFVVTDADSPELAVSDTPEVTEDRSFTFMLKVTDSNGATASDSVEVVLRELPDLNIAIGGIKKLEFAWEDIAGVDHYRLLENPDAVSGFAVIDTLVSDITASTRGIPVHLLDWANASYLVEACFDAECTEKRSGAAAAITDLVTTEAIAYVKASDPGNINLFSEGVALSGDGNTLAVGAPYGGSVATSGGAVYIFVRDATGGWQQQAKLMASNTDATDLFGGRVALSHDGGTLASSAILEDSGANGMNGDQSDNSVSDSGAVYIFTRDDDSNWSQQAYIKASNSGFIDHFGISLGLSADGNTLAIGANLEDGGASGVDGDPFNDDRTDSGAVYVYTRDETQTWSHESYIKASNPDVEDFFGATLALSGNGNTLAVGAHFEDGNATGVNGPNNDDANNSGAVYVYTRNASGNWTHQAYVKASNTGAGDRFGFGLALAADGNTLAVGATAEDSNARGVSPPGAGNNESRFDSGAAYVFLRDEAGAWTQESYLKASNADELDNFGSGVALSADGRVLAITALAEDGNATGVSTDGSGEFDKAPFSHNMGAAYVFMRGMNDKWLQRSYVKAANTGRGDMFGNSVTLSAEGGTLAIGAAGEDGGSPSINGEDNDDVTNSGAVYIY